MLMAVRGTQMPGSLTASGLLDEARIQAGIKIKNIAG